MIYRTNRTPGFRLKRQISWHKWFAWKPVCVQTHPDGSQTKVWLRYVWRRRRYYSSYKKPYLEYSVNKPKADLG